MPEFGPNLPGPQTVQTLIGIAIALLVLRVLVALVVAVWMFRDAEARGKHGIAAALIALLSGFYGMPLTVMVVCAWILFRPQRLRRGPSDDLPDQLPPEIQAAPSSEEFLNELTEKS